MTNSKPSLRFDHREVAVLFSLFIFVSLLMFTVGILVGKGLSQQSNPSAVSHHEDEAESEAVAEAHPPAHQEAPGTTPEATTEAAATTATEDAVAKSAEPATAEVAKADPPPLNLVPKTPQVDLAGTSLKEPSQVTSTDALLQNPKIRSLIDDAPTGGNKEAARAIASVGNPSNDQPPAANLAKGAYTVQVGSYPTQRDATERVEKLKKVGFPHAFFSAKKLMGSQETWYRVWLGYFAEEAGAQKSAEWLQKRGEVKNYLVRRSGAEK